MPPPDNNVKAVALTSDELGLIKLWIDQGATGQVDHRCVPLHWQKLARHCAADSGGGRFADGELAACGRDNEIYVYGIDSGASVARLVDPALAGQSGGGGPGVAHLDLVQSLAFQPSGDLLASGGFREVKLWQRPRQRAARHAHWSVGAMNVSRSVRDGKRAATGEPAVRSGSGSWAPARHSETLTGHTASVTGLAFSSDGNTLFSSSSDKSVRAWKTADGSAIGKIDTPAAVNAMILAHGGTAIR